MADQEAMAAAQELTAAHLDVYDTRDGWWSPEPGSVEIPQAWEFLPTGDAFVTRTVKAAGTYWLAWQPRSRNRRHRRLLGLWAPAEAIRVAQQRAVETATKRTVTRAASARSRARAEERYQQELRAAILDFLDFGHAHAELAETIAAETAAHAAVVSSGRVARTRKLPLEERAALAARAHIRHRYTSYEDDLARVPIEDWDEDDVYREVKGTAHEAVDDFLAQHRRRQPAPDPASSPSPPDRA